MFETVGLVRRETNRALCDSLKVELLPLAFKDNVSLRAERKSTDKLEDAGYSFTEAYVKVTRGVFLEPVMRYTVIKARNQLGSCGGDYSKALGHIKRHQQISLTNDLSMC